MKLNRILGFQSFSTQKKEFYGNPTLYQKKLMESPDPLWDLYKETGLWNTHTSKPYPSEKDSIKEIEELKSLQSVVESPQDPKYVSPEFIIAVEKNHAEVWCKWLEERGKKVHVDALKKFMDSTDAILFKLKYYFQRARPSQFAYLRNIPFYPILNSDADSPAYPSGHALDSYKMAYAIGKKFPEIKREAEEFSAKTAYTRLVGGVHYPSDHTFSKEIFEDLENAGILDKAIEIYPF
jgi:hypothetical protein